jgi:hypothetical protein
MSTKTVTKKTGQRQGIAAPSGALVPSGKPGDVVQSGHVTGSTARALVLRNGRHGAMGTGEIVALGRLSGREKLELLAGMHFDCRRFQEALFSCLLAS